MNGLLCTSNKIIINDNEVLNKVFSRDKAMFAMKFERETFAYDDFNK